MFSFCEGEENKLDFRSGKTFFEKQNSIQTPTEGKRASLFDARTRKARRHSLLTTWSVQWTIETRRTHAHSSHRLPKAMWFVSRRRPSPQTHYTDLIQSHRTTSLNARPPPATRLYLGQRSPGETTILVCLFPAISVLHGTRPPSCRLPLLCASCHWSQGGVSKQSNLGNHAMQVVSPQVVIQYDLGQILHSHTKKQKPSHVGLSGRPRRRALLTGLPCHCPRDCPEDFQG